MRAGIMRELCRGANSSLRLLSSFDMTMVSLATLIVIAHEAAPQDARKTGCILADAYFQARAYSFPLKSKSGPAGHTISIRYL